MQSSSLAAFAAEALAAGALVLRQLVAGLALAVTSYIAGRTLLGILLPCHGRPRRAGSEPDLVAEEGVAAETAVVATALGLAVVAEAGLLLGLAGWLRPGPVLLVVLGIHLAGLPVWRSLVGELRSSAAGRVPRPGQPRRGRRRLLRPAAWVFGILPFALLTLYPPTAFDATLYHLPFARAFAATGSLPFLPAMRIPIFPQLLETLFALLLPFAGDLAAHAVALIATILTASLLLLWGRRVSPAAGWIAAAAFAGSPLVVYLAGTAYVEPGLVLFATAACYAAARWRDGGGEGWLTLAALFAGAAADTKYLGLLVLASVALAAAVVTPAGPAVPRWRRLARVAAAAGIAIAPWYGRIVAATGNPLFPFLPEVFGSSPWSPKGLGPPAGFQRHLGRLALDLVRLPWDVVFARRRLGGYPPYSPIFLLALPALLAAAWRRRRVRLLLLAAAGYAAVVLALLPDARYLLVALPLVCLAVGESLAAPLTARAHRRRLDGRPAAAAGMVLALAIFLPGWSYAGYCLYRQGPVPATPAEREAYLARWLPAYPSIRYLDRACGGSYTLYAIHAENMAYFAAGRFLGDWTGPAAYGLILPADGDPLVLYRRLRAIGVDHLLTVAGDRDLPIFSARFASLFQVIYRDGRVCLFALRGTSCRPPA